jgi:hypothetical protein
MSKIQCKRCGLFLPYKSVCHACVVDFRDANPTYTLQQIANEFILSRERVRQILKMKKRPTVSSLRIINQKKKICPECGNKKGRSSRICKVCYIKSHRIQVTCSWCGKQFLEYLSLYNHKINTHHQEKWFCSRRCLGKNTAKLYGFKRKYSPEEAIIRKKEYVKTYVKTHREEAIMRRNFRKKHTNRERMSIICSLLDGAKNEVTYKKLFEVINKVFPDLFISERGLRMFLSYRSDLFEINKKGKITLKR